MAGALSSDQGAAFTISLKQVFFQSITQFSSNMNMVMRQGWTKTFDCISCSVKMGLQMCSALHLLEITRGEVDQILYVTNITLNALHCSDPKRLRGWCFGAWGEASEDVHHLV